jgi:hypothetical protein
MAQYVADPRIPATLPPFQGDSGVAIATAGAAAETGPGNATATTIVQPRQHRFNIMSPMVSVVGPPCKQTQQEIWWGAEKFAGTASVCTVGMIFKAAGFGRRPGDRAFYVEGLRKMPL